MRHLAFCIFFSALGLCVRAASPAATQQWVRDYVRTNVSEIAATTATTGYSMTVTDEDTGKSVEVTLGFSQAANTNAALAVSESNVSGVEVGLKFAKTGDYEYLNATNTACTTLSGAVEQYGYMLSDGFYQYVTNGTSVTTNALYATTNANYMTRFTAYVNGEKFRSTEVIAGTHLFVGETNASNCFRLVSVVIGDAERKAITASTVAAMGGYSILDLLFPSAFAIYNDGPTPNGDVELVSEEESGSQIIQTWRYYYTGKVLTDAADATTIGVSGINWGGNTIDFVWDVHQIQAGMLVTDVMEAYYEADDMYNDGTLLASFKAALSQALGAKNFRQLERATTGDGKNALAAALGEMMDNFDKYMVSRKFTDWKDWLKEHNNDNNNEMADPYAYHVDMTKSVDKESEDKTPPSKPKPPDTPLAPVHVHSNPTGICGAWICGICGMSYVPGDSAHPQSHVWEWSDNGYGCQHCTKCGVSGIGDARHTGWRNETILMNSTNRRYPGWRAAYSYHAEGDAGSDYRGFYERCEKGGTHFLRDHELTYTNLWTKYKNDEGIYDPDSDCRHRVCSHYKWKNSIPENNERCDCGVRGDEAVMMAAGIWLKDSHSFKKMSAIGKPDHWNYYPTNEPLVCWKDVVCSHSTHTVNGQIVNDGCGYLDVERDIHEPDGNVPSCALDSGDADYKTKHKCLFECAHNGCTFQTNLLASHSFGLEFVTNAEHTVSNHWVCQTCINPGSVDLGNASYTVNPCGTTFKMHQEPHTFDRNISYEPVNGTWVEKDDENAGHIKTAYCTCTQVTNYAMEAHEWIKDGEPYFTNDVYHIQRYVCKMRDLGCNAVGYKKTKHDNYDDDKWAINVWSKGKYVDNNGGFHARTNHCDTCDHDYGDSQGCRYFSGGNFVEYPKEKDEDGAPHGLSWFKGTCPYCESTHYIFKGNWKPYPLIFVVEPEDHPGSAAHVHSFYKGSHIANITGNHQLDSSYYVCSDMEAHNMLDGKCIDCGYMVSVEDCEICRGDQNMCFFPSWEDKCLCPMCVAGEHDNCICHLASNWTISGTGISANQYANSHTGDPMKVVSAPEVTSCADGGMRNSCSGSSLVVAGFNMMQTAGNGAFSDAFKGCESLMEVDFPLLETAGDDCFDPAFGGCTNLHRINFPSLEYCGNHCFGSAFTGCVNLATAKLEKVVSVGSNCFNNAFLNCGNLLLVDLKSLEIIWNDTPRIFYGAFNGCDSLREVDLRNIGGISANMFDANGSCNASNVTFRFGPIELIGDYEVPLCEMFDVGTYYFDGLPCSMDYATNYFMNPLAPTRIRVQHEFYRDWLTNSLWNAYTNRMDFYDSVTLSEWTVYTNGVATAFGGPIWNDTDSPPHWTSGDSEGYWECSGPNGDIYYYECTNVWWTITNEDEEGNPVYNRYDAYRHWVP